MLYNWLPRTIALGPLSINVFGVSVALGIVVGLAIAVRMAKQRGIDSDLVTDFALYAMIAGLVGARIVFVLFDIPHYVDHPWEIFMVNHGGLSIHGAILGGALAAAVYCRKKNISFWTLADVMAPALALGEAVGRIGCDVYGRMTDSAPFALEINGQTFHNVPLYTSISLLAIFAILWRLRGQLPEGRLFWLFVLLYSIDRFGIEFFRQSVMVGSLSVTQAISIVLVVLATMRLYRPEKQVA